MFTVIYHWRVRPELETEFQRTWHIRTAKIKMFCGSYGSRLHKGDDGTYFAIALWPTRELWQAPFNLPDDADDERVFRSSIAASLGTQTMTVVDDLWNGGLDEDIGR